MELPSHSVFGRPLNLVEKSIPPVTTGKCPIGSNSSSFGSHVCSLCKSRRADILISACGHKFHGRCFWQLPLEACPVCNVPLLDGTLFILPFEQHFDQQVQAITAEAPGTLRQGRWNEHELLYAEEVIQRFLAGDLKITENTKLCPFLCNLLQCSAERLSKKLKLGKRYYSENKQRVTDLPTMKKYFEDHRRLSKREEQFLQEEKDSQHNSSEVAYLASRIQQTWREQFIEYAKSVGQTVVADLPAANDEKSTRVGKRGLVSTLNSIATSVTKLQLKNMSSSTRYPPDSSSQPINTQAIQPSKKPFQLQMAHPVLNYSFIDRQVPDPLLHPINKDKDAKIRLDFLDDPMELCSNVFDQNDSLLDYLNLEDYEEILSPTTLALIQSPSPMNSSFFTVSEDPTGIFVGFSKCIPKIENPPSASMPFENFIGSFLNSLPLFDAVDVWVPCKSGISCQEVILSHAGSFEKSQDLQSWSHYSRGFEFKHGLGLIGRVFGSNACEWQIDVGAMLPFEFLRTQGAKTLGIRTCFGIPVHSENGSRFVVAFYSRQSFSFIKEIAQFMEQSVRSWNFRSTFEKSKAETLPISGDNLHVDCKFDEIDSSDSSDDGSV